MIHVMLPTQYLRRADSHLVEPHRRLIAAVLQTVVDDCGGSAYWRARGYRSRSPDMIAGRRPPT